MNEKFEIHDTLNPKIWSSDNKLLPEVEDRLFAIVEQFKSDISLPIDIVDVHIVGSNASYNYTETSDVDVHIIANYESVSKDTDIVQSAYNLEKSSFNRNYDISIHGVEVEIYVEDVRSNTVSNGIYSLYQRKWIKFPTPIEGVEEYDLSNLVKVWEDKVADALKKESRDAQRLLNTIYLVRKNSLSVDGEYGKGNALFKELRSLGLIGELRKKAKQDTADDLSLEGLNESLINEASRSELMTKSKTSVKGRERFNRRNRSKVANTVKQFNSIDMNKLFKQNILTVNISVRGETDDYTVRISFGGFLDILHDEMRLSQGEPNLKAITRALITGFNKDDIFVGCSCPDYRYRYGFWGTKNGVTSVDPENRPSDITNPNDKLGSGCKHILLVLSNNSWILKCASVINNYIKYMQQNYQKLYADIIYPAIYQKPYEDGVQLGMFDDENGDELKTDTDTINKANVHVDRDDAGRFTTGNKQGIRFAPSKTDKNQVEFDVDDEV